MTPEGWLLIAWGVVTGVLLIRLFHRGTLTRQEDDQPFLMNLPHQGQWKKAN